MKELTVGIDVAPLYSGHKVRGVGFYTQRLLDGFKTYRGLGISIKELKNKEEILNADYDLLHIPYFSPFFVTLPLAKKKPLVVTIHDLIPLKYLSHYPPGLKGSIRWQIQKLLLRRADGVITDSLVSKRDINRFSGVPLNKISVIYLAAGKDFRRLKIGNWESEIKQKYHLPDVFVLYVGDVNWNKNVPELVRACKETKIPLVIVGRQALEDNFDPSHPENIDLVWLRQQTDQKSVIALGFVETSDLVKIYNLATMYCQPSFDEGFGLPVLEAMACGCPVISSNLGSLPEVVGQGGLTNSPSARGLASMITKVVKNKGLQKSLIEKGLTRTADFSWSKTVTETAEVYKSIEERKNKEGS